MRKFLFIVAAVFCLSFCAAAQNECVAAGYTPWIYGAVHDANGVLHQSMCVDSNANIIILAATNPTHVTDFPSKFFIPAALCNNATPATTWSLPTSAAATPTCATGTNTQVGTLNFADANSAQATYYLPSDWDSTSSVDSTIFFTSSSTSGTVIFNVAVSCTNVNGTQTDDQAFNTATAYATITLNATANAVWSASATGLTMANCTAGELAHWKITRATDTAADTGVAVRGVSLTVRRTF